ncbi:MAG: bifunctional isocitrate dehydrogenase kinase/phosphatase [Pseudomonadales bacterium]|nr:bifunctional isocitrate dehydrogenase kinase/phosphatase [Pseudomonadales bacterium]
MVVSERAVAQLVLDHFDSYRDDFREITLGARKRFERADWIAAGQASMARIELYDRFSRGLISALNDLQGETPLALAQWGTVKHHYETLIARRPDFSLAETVFNTVFRRTFGGEDLSDEHAFVRESLTPTPVFEVELSHTYGPSLTLAELFRQVLTGYEFELPWLNLETDIQLMVATMRASIPLLRTPQEISFEMLKSVFYRNKGAYLIGRMFVGEHVFPIAVPIHNSGEALYVDTIIWNDNDLSIIFSFTRSYFMVDVDYPNEMVDFLMELLPNKKRWEMYTSLGFYKHGKTEFYRNFLAHLEHSDDKFVVAEGIRGLVMAVFTLPSYQTVFKIIRDKFSPTKKVTRQQVRDAYYLVKTHDRVGRMADTQEFSNFVLPRDRFSDELIEELTQQCASSIRMTETEVVILHLYTERRMTPLNIYLEHASEFEQRQVLDEYGNAIKQLAAANIFPGDMLLKNFGVTRHRRVVFYDYDEICYLTDVNFRRIPEARYPEDELSAEPWYSVGPDDVFPEEFEKFLFNTSHLKEIFRENHADLFTVEYWQDVQQKIRDQQVMDVYPYRRKRSFRRSFSGTPMSSADPATPSSV